MDRFFCPQCGTPSPGSAKFCFRCGHSFEEVLAVAPSQRAEPAPPEDAPIGPPVAAAVPLAPPLDTARPDPGRSALPTRPAGRGGRRRERAIAGGALMMAGALLLIAAISVGWYTISVHTPNSTETLKFSPSGQVTVTSPGHRASGTFAQAGLNNTGGLYGDVEGLLVLGFLCAGSGGAMGLGSAWRPGLRKAAMILGVLGLAFALFGPFLLAVNQPMALNSDSPSTSGLGGASSGTFANGTGPGTTFSGSALSPRGSATWGPDVGWFVGIGAGGIIFVGAVLAVTARPLDRVGGSPVGVPTPPGHVWTLVPATRPGSSAPPATGVSPAHWCPSCQIGFATAADLDRHRQDFHGAPPPWA